MMLSTLSIFNFAIIEQVELEFSDGMTAITGESGVGKSIILEALKFTMGYRASQELTSKNGNQRTEVRASFDISKQPEIHAWLKSRDFDHENECIIRRIMTPEGRSRAYINSTPCTLSDLKEISCLLIHLHGQHGYQALMHSHMQREMLDCYSGCENQARKVRQIWCACKKNEEKIKAYHENAEEKDAQLQLLHYQVNEMKALAMGENELETLEKEQTLLADAEENRMLCHTTQSILSDKDNSIVNQIGECRKNLSDDPAFSEALKLLEEAQILIEETDTMISGFEQEIRTDPERLAKIESRLSSIHELARKHRTTPQELPALYKTLADRLEAAESVSEDIASIEQQNQELKAAFYREAEKLGVQRAQGAIKLAKAINIILAKTGMKDTTFQVLLERQQPADSSGIDRVVFQVKNKHSEHCADLDKIASGGELSRISLAIQIATAKSNGVKTLLFDEIDSGIGGAAAEMVGRLLQKLGEKSQVFCITHQAQVASQAHAHLSVIKSMKKHQSVNTVQSLDNKLRERELARMIAGIEITKPALAHAREMIHRAHKNQQQKEMASL